MKLSHFMASEVSYPITAVMNLYITLTVRQQITVRTKGEKKSPLKCGSNWLRIRPLRADRFSYFETSNWPLSLDITYKANWGLQFGDYSQKAPR